MTRQNIYEFIISELQDASPNSRVLNVGSGGDVETTIQRVQKKKGFSLTSIDISETRRPDIVADVCSFRTDDKYDFVVMSEVLEHIPEPHLAIKNIEENILSGRGKLVMTVPFIYPLHDRPHDYFRYTKYGLQYLLRNFKDVSIKERSGWYEVIFMLQARFLRENVDSVLGRAIKIFVAVPSILFYGWASILSRLARSDYMTSGYLVACRNNDPRGR